MYKTIFTIFIVVLLFYVIKMHFVEKFENQTFIMNKSDEVQSSLAKSKMHGIENALDGGDDGMNESIESTQLSDCNKAECPAELKDKGFSCWRCTV